ncbi:MAG: hypothetical protein M3Y39_12640 [Chloroflexota bacterium]|nr:hypothetical protein [Chloroflexota bacterium]
MPTQSTICLVTIHGIGFEQSPVLDADNKYTILPGYADALHEHLSSYLGATLSDDPQRARHQAGEAGPIYVSSVWPPNTRKREEGLKRLGTWDASGFRGQLDASNAPLTDGKGTVSHIALVYSELEGQTPQLGAALVAGSMSALNLSHYASVLETIRLTFTDTQPFWNHLLHLWDNQALDQSQASAAANPSLKVRRDLHPQAAAPSENGHALQGLIAVLRQLENDVAAYVCHNEQRERVRGFVLDALLRLASRDDVEGIVINSHSNGTVVALDVLRDLPPFAAKKILGFVTAGSPLRKYSDFFNWGEHMSTIPRIEKWLNFLDPKDPVADPLGPDASWKRGKQVTKKMLTGLYKALDPNTGEVFPMRIDDRKVDNLKHSTGGGLQAHNYWDNEPQFVKPLGDLLCEFALRTAPVVSQAS